MTKRHLIGSLLKRLPVSVDIIGLIYLNMLYWCHVPMGGKIVIDIRSEVVIGWSKTPARIKKCFVIGWSKTPVRIYKSFGTGEVVTTGRSDPDVCPGLL